MPNEPEVTGLLALMRLHLARAAARFDADGGIVLLADQDRSTWDRDAIARLFRCSDDADASSGPVPTRYKRGSPPSTRRRAPSTKPSGDASSVSTARSTR